MILSALFTLASALSASPALLACGDDQVRRYELAAEGPRETWRWDAEAKRWWLVSGLPDLDAAR